MLRTLGSLDLGESGWPGVERWPTRANHFIRVTIQEQAPSQLAPTFKVLVGRGGGQGIRCGRSRSASWEWERELWALTRLSDRSRKELREKGPPRVLEPLKDVVLIEGSAAKLTCRISAFPDPFIRWSKDGKELRDGPKYRYVFEDPDVVALVVRDGELADLGQYSINVTNPFGQCSDSARILVEGTRAPAAAPPPRAAPLPGAAAGSSQRALTAGPSRVRRGLGVQPGAQRRAGLASLSCLRIPFLPETEKSVVGSNHSTPGPQGHSEPEAGPGVGPRSSGSAPGQCSLLGTVSIQGTQTCKHSRAFTHSISFDPPSHRGKEQGQLLVRFNS